MNTRVSSAGNDAGAGRSPWPVTLGQSALEVGETAPEFKLASTSGVDISLGDFAAAKALRLTIPPALLLRADRVIE